MAHTPQALVFSPVQRSPANSARAAEQESFDRAADAIRPSWPTPVAARPTRPRMLTPKSFPFAHSMADEIEGNPFRKPRSSGRWKWFVLLAIGIALAFWMLADKEAPAQSGESAPANAPAQPTTAVPPATEAAKTSGEEPASSGSKAAAREEPALTKAVEKAGQPTATKPATLPAASPSPVNTVRPAALQPAKAAVRPEPAKPAARSPLAATPAKNSALVAKPAAKSSLAAKPAARSNLATKPASRAALGARDTALMYPPTKTVQPAPATPPQNNSRRFDPNPIRSNPYEE